MQRGENPTTSVKASTYPFFFVRCLFLRDGTTGKLAEVRKAGSMGAALAVVLTLTLPVGVNVALVRIRMRFLPSPFFVSWGLTRGETAANLKASCLASQPTSL